MKPRSIRLKIALTAGLLSSLVVVSFAVLSAWRFYHEQLDVLRNSGPHRISERNLAEAREEVGELAVSYALALPFVAALAAAGAWWMAGRLVRPLNQLADLAEKMDARTLHERLPEAGGQDEISRLARVMNSLFARLEKSFVQASRFAADASHELRTPLAVNRLLIEDAIRQDPNGSSTKVLVRVLEENQRLSSIADKLLLLARADAEKLIAVQENIEVSELLLEMTEDIAILAREAGVKFEHDIAGNLEVRGDRALLGQTFLNLLENAVKYNEPNGWILARLERAEKGVVFSLSNSGPPIPAELQARLFERFFRVNEARDRSSEGTGLGLSICKEIALAHGGRLELVSSDAQGTLFRLHLPAL